MTYNLINNNLIPVRSIVYNNRRITNPADTLVIQLGFGYPLVQTPEPEYNPETQYVAQSYRQESNSIVEVWTILEIPNDSELSQKNNESSDVQENIPSIKS